MSIIALLIVLAACGQPPIDMDGGTVINLGADITRSELGDDWPFSVEAGRLQCIGSRDAGKVYFMTSNITTYAVNEHALAEGKMPDIRDSAIYTGRDLAPLIEIGINLCS